jgi:hypothetical protein
MIKNFCLLVTCIATGLIYSAQESLDKDRLSARKAYYELFGAARSPYYPWDFPYASILSESYRQWQSNKQDPQLILSLIQQKALKEQRYFLDRQAGKFNIEALDLAGVFILASIASVGTILVWSKLKHGETAALERRLESLGLRKEIERDYYGDFIVERINFAMTRQNSAAELEIIESDLQRLRQLYGKQDLVGALMALGVTIIAALGVVQLQQGSTAVLKANAAKCAGILQEVNEMIGAKE